MRPMARLTYAGKTMGGRLKLGISHMKMQQIKGNKSKASNATNHATESGNAIATAAKDASPSSHRCIARHDSEVPTIRAGSVEHWGGSNFRLWTK